MHNQIIGICSRFLFSSAALLSAFAASSAWAATAIDTNAPYYLSSELGTTVLPDFQGGTLRIDQSGASYSQNFTIENYPSNTIDFFGHSVTLSGVLSGAGGLTLRDSTTYFNRLLLTGSNTYTGLTTLVGSTLVVGNGGTAGSIAGDVTYKDAVWTCNGQPCVYTVVIPGLIFNRGDTIVYSGNYLNQSTGSGTFVQAGTGTLVLTGTVTSPTWITNGGTIQIGNGGASGSIVGSVAFVGANPAAKLVFDRSDSYIYAGAIAGTGEVDQTGTGTLILNGVSTFAGVTNVLAGTLELGDAAHSGALLRSNVAITSGAMLTGHGTISGAVSNYGTVAPGGSLGTLTVGSFTQSVASRLQIAVAPGESSSLVVTNAATLDGALKLDFAPGLYRPQIDRILSAASISGQFATVTNNAPTDTMFTLSSTATAIDLVVEPTLAGQIFADTVTSAIDSAHGLGSELARHDDDHDCARACSGVSLWLMGFAGAGALDADNAGASAFSTRHAGVIGGLDYGFADGTVLGAVVSYDQSTLHVADAWGRALTNAISVALNGGVPVLDGRLSANIFYTANTTTGHRDLGSLGLATSRPGSHVIGGALQFSYPLGDGDFTPLARLSVVQVSRAAAVESGADGLDLASDAQRYTSARGTLGLRFRHSYHLDDGLAFTPDARGGVAVELISTSRPVAIWLLDNAAMRYSVPYARADRVAFTAGVGLTLQLDEAIAFRMAADGRASSHQRDGTLSVEGHIRF